ncbi:hypothetical protein MAR_001537 [Mya arenaria]|uniref:Uncharacterized protein n=1 Tax=Mya arenaria TaxID=6604 RepID=A0ABY7FFR4_MYAAR|nr:hypothetical protein MAR_001537 [Mya arenaria]
MSEMSEYILPRTTGICVLDCAAAFKDLTDTEKQHRQRHQEFFCFSRKCFGPSRYTIWRGQPRQSGSRIWSLRLIALRNKIDSNFEKLLLVSAAGKTDMTGMKSLWDSVVDRINRPGVYHSEGTESVQHTPIQNVHPRAACGLALYQDAMMTFWAHTSLRPKTGALSS